MVSNGEKIHLVVIFGGQSAEHDVSCTTAAHVLAAADPRKYSVSPIGITRDGQWVRAQDAVAALEKGAGHLPAALSPSGDATSMVAAVSAPTPGQTVVVLPLLHGPLGEDGTVQGMLELTGVPYVGAGVLGSALAMDKVKAKEVLAAHGVPQTNFVGIYEGQWDGDTDKLIDQLGLPCFVKPANMGSSVGVSKANTTEELVEAIDLAFRYDEWIVIEEAVVGREIEVAVLGNDEPRLSVPGEIVPGAEFYDYEDKYVDGSAKLIIPAELSRAEVAKMEAMAVKAFKALRVEGMARADFLYEESGRGWLVNELNTIPGFTPISMYPKLWEASGLKYPELIDELVGLALERQQRRAAKRETQRNPR